MLLISHRGNIFGRELNRENNPRFIQELTYIGYHVEVDIRYLDGEWWLGHDEADYKVGFEWLLEHKAYLWLHTKNISALEFLLESKSGLRYFWHEHDKYTLTSTGHIWTYPGTPVSKHSIIVSDTIPREKCFGVCTDRFFDLEQQLQHLYGSDHVF